MEMEGEATGLPGSGQSGTEADDQEAWGEMEDENAIRLLTPDPQPPDAGEAGAIGCWQNLQPRTKMGAERTRMGTGYTQTRFSAHRRFICPRGTERRE